MYKLNGFSRRTPLVLLAASMLLVVSCAAWGQPAIVYDTAVEELTVAGMEIWTYRNPFRGLLPVSEAEALAELLIDYTRADLWPWEMEVLEDEGRMLYRSGSDASAVFDFDLWTGDFLFNGGLARYGEEGDTPNLVSADEAPVVALQLAEELGLLPPEYEMVLAHVGGLNMAVRRTDGTTDDYRKLVVVRFEREIEGLPVHGLSLIHI